MKEVLAIDPGNIESAYVVMDYETYKPLRFGKIPNEEFIDLLKTMCDSTLPAVVIEMIASYGMPVGKEVFDTCVWIGRFYEAVSGAQLMFRKDVKMNMCNSTRAKDGNIIQALKDRFGDKGTKTNPGWFYGFKADCWQAYALGVTYIDKLKEKNNVEI
jgi:hypothetical protein